MSVWENKDKARSLSLSLSIQKRIVIHGHQRMRNFMILIQSVIRDLTCDDACAMMMIDIHETDSFCMHV